MLPFARQPAGNSRAVIGDTNAQTATIVPTLSEAADSQNLVVSADTSVLNKNQVLNLDDTFYETITNEVWPQQLQEGKIAIAGTTMGWLDTQKCFLEIPFRTTFTTVGTVPADMLTPDSLGERPSNTYENWSEYTQPEFHMLRPIRRFQVFLGENNVSVQRAQMNFAQNFPTIIYDRKYNRNDYNIISALGYPISIGSHASQSAAGGTATFINAGVSKIRQEYNDERKNAFFSMNRTRNNNGKSYLVVPLYCLNSFFRENQYLPPGLKFRFELEYTTGAVEIQRSSIKATTEGVNTWSISYEQDIRFNAFAYILRAGTQEQINRNWITNPFLYNYTTYEYLERKMNGTSQTYYENICISQQRPTDIILRVVNEGANGLLTTPPGINYVYNNAGVPGIAFHDIKINIAGRLQYHFRNADLITDGAQQHSGGMPNMVDALMNTASNDTWRNANEEEFLVQPATRGIKESNWCVISIQPGNMQSIGNYSTDQGAVSVQMEINITMNNKERTPLPSTLKLVIYKKLTEQLAIDANKNVQIIQWPAVKSNSGYVVQQTFNMN